MFRWVYQRKNAAEGEFALFSDIDSRIKHLMRIRIMLLVVLFINLWTMFYNLYLYYYSNGVNVNLVCSGLSLAVNLFILYGISRFSKRIKRLKKERITIE